MQPAGNEEILIKQKWKAIDNVIEEVQNLQNMEREEYSEKFEEIVNKLVRLKSLKQSIENDEKDLQLQYLLLMRERNLYFEKLKMIQAFCEDQDEQNPNNPLLQSMKNILYNLGNDESI